MVDGPDSDVKMPLLDHLVELRKRLMWSFITLIVLTFAFYGVAEHIYQFLVSPLAHAYEELGAKSPRMIFTALHEAARTNHVVVVRDELLSEHPDLGARLFEAFAASKRTYVDDLRAGRIDRPTRIDRAHIRVMDVLGTGDPLPYGVRPNLPTLERILRHAKDQHILTKTPALDEVFARGTMELVG